MPTLAAIFMKIKILLSLALIGSISFNSCKQGNSIEKYFEGSISYKFEVQAEKDSIKLLQEFGRGAILFFKNGNFIHKYESSIYVMDLYNQKENKLYIRKRGSDSLLIVDCSLSGSQIESLALNPKKETVLGILCDELVIHYKEKTVVDYFNSDTLKINPRWFRKFNFDEENRIDQKEKSIFLKRKIIYPEYTLVQTATFISPGKIDTNSFNLSDNAILINLR